jgi:hypothetical protein
MEADGGAGLDGAIGAGEQDEGCSAGALAGGEGGKLTGANEVHDFDGLLDASADALDIDGTRIRVVDEELGESFCAAGADAAMEEDDLAGFIDGDLIRGNALVSGEDSGRDPATE